MDGKMLARLGAVVFVAIAVTATAIEMTRKEEVPATEPVRLLEPARNPLREGQRRCQRLGEAAASDPECLAVWAETRDRFLGRAPAPTAAPTPEGR
ncbi:MAG: putative entry exclusion protein TrbK-alt [Alphaproteobacteria bacterium]|nr:putative entry exclusion protein TrbK-alt [Alphaproteobacteria bacterium]MBU2229996.1 putative entry exclusion protein TrbK-alt [Alphaproteobacteria bacterium]